MPPTKKAYTLDCWKCEHKKIEQNIDFCLVGKYKKKLFIVKDLRHCKLTDV